MSSMAFYGDADVARFTLPNLHPTGIVRRQVHVPANIEGRASMSIWPMAVNPKGDEER